jgi:hypothetical protein
MTARSEVMRAIQAYLFIAGSETDAGQMVCVYSAERMTFRAVMSKVASVMRTLLRYGGEEIQTWLNSYVQEARAIG